MGATPEVPGNLDELDAARLAEGRTILAGLVSEYDALQAAVSAEWDEELALRGEWVEGPASRALDAWDVADRLTGLRAEQVRCLLFAVAERLASGSRDRLLFADCFEEIAGSPPDLVAGDVRLLAAVSEPDVDYEAYRPFEFVVDMAEALVADGAVGAEALAGALAGQVLGWNAMVYYWQGADWVLRAGEQLREHDQRTRVAELRDRVLELAGRPPALPALEGPVCQDEGWGLAVIGRLALMEDWPAGVKALLEHYATARTPRPGPRWEKVCRQRLETVADPSGLLRHLLELVISTEPVSYLTDQGRRTLLVGFNEQLLRGVVWAAGLLDPPWLPEVLRQVAVRCLRLCSGHVFRDTAVQGEKIPYACFRALAASGSDASLLALARIGQATSNGSVLKHLAKTLEEASARRGMSPASLLERLTPDHGIGPDGLVSFGTGSGRWVIRLDDRQSAIADGPPGVTVPPQVSGALPEIRATVSAARVRLEALFAEPRQWHAEDFADCYLRHPLTGWLATRLAWTFSPPGGPAIHGFPDRDGASVRTPHGAVAVPSGSLVQLLHPVRLAAGELGEFRLLCGHLRITQPLRQFWRETYQLTAAERETGLYTERYAGHILRFRQGYGLARRRGWTGGFLSAAWDGGDSAVARRDYPAAGLRASWALAQLGDPADDIAVDLCMTERVWFSPLGDLA